MPPPSSAPRKPNPNTGSTEKNEYIPQFISKKPFYVAEDSDLTHSTNASDTSKEDYLKHQRLTQPTNPSSLSAERQWFLRGTRPPSATKWREGACENCGAMGHKKKECLYRPRKVGAKWSGRDIMADDVAKKFNFTGWDAKRDPWNSYDVSDYSTVLEEKQEVERIKRQKLSNAGAESADTLQETILDGDRYEEEADMGREQSTATRNLRIREDTAQYLVNLDPESAKYDPKSRRMIDNVDESAGLAADEGFVRPGEGTGEFGKAQRAAWDSQERGDKSFHMQANPTSGVYSQKKESEEKERKKEEQRKLLAAKYGNQEQFKPPEGARPTAVEQFVEYDERGKIKGKPKAKVKSRYAENVLVNNHTSVWGSWWTDFKWGYACCHSTVKNSYCTADEEKKENAS